MAEKSRAAAHKADHYHDVPKSAPAEEPVSPETEDFKTPDVAAEETTPPETSAPKTAESAPSTAVVSVHKRGGFWGWCCQHKVVCGIIAFVLVVILLAGVPWTRYKIGGLFIKQTIAVDVTDSQTHQAVTSAIVSAKNVTAKTDNKGQTHLRIPIGPATITVQKTYYQTAKTSVTVPLKAPKTAIMVNFKATGRQVPVVVINKLTGKPIDNAVVTSGSAEAKTTSDGKATMVLPTVPATVTVTIKANDYNTTTATIQVTTQAVAANSITMTPAGMVYFLSNKSGKIDVVKTNLDGTNRQTVLAGTGSEDLHGTVLLASRDWKYLTLLSKRDGGDYAKLFLIDTSTDKLTTMDEGQATFSLIGWHDHTLAYSVTRDQQKVWQPNYEAVKSYNADSSTLLTLDQTQASGDQASYTDQSFGNFYITDDGLVYSTTWDAYPFYSTSALLAGKTNSIRTITVDGKNKKDVKTFDSITNGYMTAHAYDPQGVYFAIYSNSTNAYTIYKYEGGAVTTTNLNQQQFDNTTYDTYLYSPSGNNTLWSDQRDGKQSLFIGDKDAQNAKQIASGTDYSGYGWYTDSYILVTKNASELYIMPVGGGAATKVSDYYKPNVNFTGYGYGYGGL
ncbi:MAG: hypothetical protein ACQR33_06405 [Candidatus Saccharibacteria bacterium]